MTKTPAQKSFDAGMEKAEAIIVSLEGMRLKEVARCMRDGAAETLTYTRFPMGYRRRIRTNNVIERLNREIRRHIRFVSTFPDGESTHTGDRPPEVRHRRQMRVEGISGCVAAGRVIMPEHMGSLRKVRKIIDTTLTC